MNRQFVMAFVAFAASSVRAGVPGDDAVARCLAVVSHDGQGQLWIERMPISPPWSVDRSMRLAGGGGMIRCDGADVLIVNRAAGKVHVLSGRDWALRREFTVAGAGVLRDAAPVGGGRAYLTRPGHTRLLLLNTESGAMVESTDLGVFADADGRPDMDTLAFDGTRLYVALRRVDDIGGGHAAPSMIAVVDAASGTLIDVDPDRPGTQAIELVGKPPKERMQILGSTLFVNATGAFFEDGGIEAVDLETLRSAGLILDEGAGETGADIGSFVMTSPTSGYLVFSTDLLLSTHPKRFAVPGGVQPGLEQFAVLNYLSPALAFDDRTGLVFLPVGGWSDNGLHVIHAASATMLTAEPIRTGGAPSDLMILAGGARAAAVPEHQATVE